MFGKDENSLNVIEYERKFFLLERETSLRVRKRRARERQGVANDSETAGRPFPHGRAEEPQLQCFPAAQPFPRSSVSPQQDQRKSCSSSPWPQTWRTFTCRVEPGFFFSFFFSSRLYFREYERYSSTMSASLSGFPSIFCRVHIKFEDSLDSFSFFYRAIRLVSTKVCEKPAFCAAMFDRSFQIWLLPSSER